MNKSVLNGIFGVIYNDMALEKDIKAVAHMVRE